MHTLPRMRAGLVGALLCAVTSGITACGAAGQKTTPASENLPPQAIQSTIQAHNGAFRACYDAGLERDSLLTGTVWVKLVIARDGSLESTTIEPKTDLPDPEAVSCVLNEMKALTFPAPETGKVTVNYPISFAVSAAGERSR
ncbi:MAG: AgmX/PglI C-terminal domain-containing protein [Polyangiaceae bacterium]